MLPILAVFILFLVILTYYIKKGDAAQSKAEEDFWEKERAANAVRKQDISRLDYITIPMDKIPQTIGTDTEKALLALSSQPMVNLTGISNTDLKLTYGTANLTLLSQYDTNFSDMVALLPKYTEELTSAGLPDSARMLLEFGISCRADSASLYRQLAGIYAEEGNTAGIQQLLDASRDLPEFTRKAVEKELSLYLQA